MAAPGDGPQAITPQARPACREPRILISPNQATVGMGYGGGSPVPHPGDQFSPILTLF